LSNIGYDEKRFLVLFHGEIRGFRGNSTNQSAIIIAQDKHINTPEFRVFGIQLRLPTFSFFPLEHERAHIQTKYAFTVNATADTSHPHRPH
jgi:hypothetical protein